MNDISSILSALHDSDIKILEKFENLLGATDDKLIDLQTQIDSILDSKEEQ